MINAADYLGKTPDEMEITWQEYAPDGRKMEFDQLPTARACYRIGDPGGRDVKNVAA